MTEHRTGRFSLVLAQIGDLRPWRAIFVGTLTAVAACGDAQTTKTRAAAALASSSSDRNVACDEGASRCADDGSRKVCRGGSFVTEACAQGAQCFARNCVALVMPDGSPLARERLRGVGAEGWLNGWSTVTPLGKRAVDGYTAALDATTIGGPKAFHATCSRDGYVVPRNKGVGKNDGQILSVASGIIISDAPRKVRLFASVSGKLDVFLGTKDVATFDETRGIEKRPLPDERALELDVPEGSSDLTAVLEAPADEERLGGFMLRFRELDGSPVRGLRFAEKFEPCSSSALLDPRADMGIDANGLFLHLDPIYRGLEPYSPKPWPIDVNVAVLGHDPSNIKVESPSNTPIKVEARSAFDLTARLEEGSATSADPLFSRSIPAYGDLVPRVAKLTHGVDEAKAKTALPRGSLDSFEMHVATLVKLITRADSDIPFIERRTKTAEHLLDRIERGEDPYAGETGVIYRAYRSALDGKLEPYVAFVPKSQDKAKAQPLVVISHGRDRLPEHALRTLIGQAPDDHMTLRFAERNLPSFPDQGALLVAPFGYDEGGSHPLGEDDLLRVIEEMSKAYKVDPRRVSLTGYSLGGTVAFVAPLHHPDVFSASAPLCGYPNLLGYSSVANVPHAPWEDSLLAKKYIVNYAENGAFLPLNVVHGGKDTPGRSKVVIDRYKSLGYSYIFDVEEDLDHNVWDHAYEDGEMVGWLTGRSRPLSPKHVRFVTGEYRYDRAYWVRLIGMKDAGDASLATIDATLSEKTKHIDVKTSGVTALSLDRDAMEPRATWADAVSITIDGEEIPLPSGSDPIFLERTDRWASVAREPSREGMKRHGVSGPLDDVLRHPITIVYGTRVASHIDANRLVAEHLGHAGGIAEVSYPILKDTEASDDVLLDRSVMLVGSPAENLLTDKLAKDLPVQFESNAIVVKGRRFEGPSLAVSFIAPRPGVPNQYVVVHAGLDEVSSLACRFLPRYLPDWVVYDARAAVERGGLLFDQRPFVGGGFFSERWD